MSVTVWIEIQMYIQFCHFIYVRSRQNHSLSLAQFLQGGRLKGEKLIFLGFLDFGVKMSITIKFFN